MHDKLGFVHWGHMFAHHAAIARGVQSNVQKPIRLATGQQSDQLLTETASPAVQGPGWGPSN